MTHNDDTEFQHHDRDESVASRSLPSIRLSLRPLNFLQFAFGLIESLVMTRNYPRMLGGLPFLAMTMLGIGCYWWVRHSSIDPVLKQYHARFDKAVAEKDVETEETCLRALCNLQPSVPEYRMRLGIYFFDRGDKEKAIREIVRLAPETTTGFPAARLWLVQHAIGPEPLIRMSREEVENQLKKVLDAKPDHVDAHQLLAALYLDGKKMREAELHLEEAAKVRPELNLQLAQIKKQMKRPGDDTDVAAARAVTELSRLLEKDRSRVDVRLGLAESLLLVENFDQAREIIVSGLLQKDDERLRNALVDLDLMTIDRRIRSSILNRDACVPIALNALKISRGIRDVLTLCHFSGRSVLRSRRNHSRRASNSGRRSWNGSPRMWNRVCISANCCSCSEKKRWQWKHFALPSLFALLSGLRWPDCCSKSAMTTVLKNCCMTSSETPRRDSSITPVICSSSSNVPKPCCC